MEEGDYGTLTLDSALKGVTIEAESGVEVDKITITADAELEDVTITGFDATAAAEVGSSYADALINVQAGATVTNLIIEDCTFAAGTAKYDVAISNAEPTASITVTNCTFDGLRAFWSTIAYAEMTFEECSFENINEWVIQHNATPYNGDLTVTDCTFTNCTDGIMKLNSNNNGYISAGYTFTFTDNTITNCKGHDQSDAKWFAVNTVQYGATAVFSGNTKDGTAWTPTSANGLTVE